MASTKKNVPSISILKQVYSEAHESLALDEIVCHENMQIDEGERYLYLRKIGCGGMKKISLVEDKKAGRLIAMAKRLRKGSDLEEQSFLREARITSCLQHPNIMPVYDLGFSSDNEPYFTMKYSMGISLRQLLNQLQSNDLETVKSFPLNERIDIYQKLCEAVAYAHSKGILHMDLKPGNVLVSDYGEVLLCDWGLAKILDAACDDPYLQVFSFDQIEQKNITENGMLKGTPGYMAPEQITVGKRKDVRTEIYSLGSILYELIYLEPLIEGNVKQKIKNTERGCTSLQKHSAQERARGLLAVVERATEFDPQKRYASVDELLDELSIYKAGFATRAESSSLLRLVKLFYLRNQRLCNVSGIFIIMLILVMFIASKQIKKRDELRLIAKDHLNLERHKLLMEQKESELRGREAAPQLLEQAEAAFVRSDMMEAGTLAQKALELHPSFDKAKYLLGRICFLLGDKDRALSLLQGSDLRLDKLLKDILVVTENAFYTADDREKAVRVLIRHCRTVSNEVNYMFIRYYCLNGDAAVVTLAVQALKRFGPTKAYENLLIASQLKDQNSRDEIISFILGILKKRPNWAQRRKTAVLGRELAGTQEVKRAFSQFVPANLALGQPVLSAGKNVKSPDLIVDGNENKSNFWVGEGAPNWLEIERPSLTHVKRVELFFSRGTMGLDRSYQYLIEVTDNGEKYSNLVDAQDNVELVRETAKVHFINFQNQTKKIRLTVLGMSRGQSVCVTEVKIFGEEIKNTQDE